jgi:acyl carrier protein
MLPGTLQVDIADLLSERIGISVPSYSTNLFEAGILDSMSFVELLIQIETQFDLSLNLGEIEFENFRSVEAIADFISSHGVRTAS